MKNNFEPDKNKSFIHLKQKLRHLHMLCLMRVKKYLNYKKVLHPYQKPLDQIGK